MGSMLVLNARFPRRDVMGKASNKGGAWGRWTNLRGEMDH